MSSTVAFRSPVVPHASPLSSASSTISLGLAKSSVASSSASRSHSSHNSTSSLFKNNRVPQLTNVTLPLAQTRPVQRSNAPIDLTSSPPQQSPQQQQQQRLPVNFTIDPLGEIAASALLPLAPAAPQRSATTLTHNEQIQLQQHSQQSQHQHFSDSAADVENSESHHSESNRIRESFSTSSLALHSDAEHRLHSPSHNSLSSAPDSAAAFNMSYSSVNSRTGTATTAINHSAACGLPQFHSDHDLATIHAQHNSNKHLLHTPAPPPVVNHLSVPAAPPQQPRSYSALDVYLSDRKGAKDFQEDSSMCIASTNNLALICAVFDGHGGHSGMLASRTAKHECASYFQQHASECEEWSIAEWKHRVESLFASLHESIRLCFMTDPKARHHDTRSCARIEACQRNNNSCASHASDSVSASALHRPSVPHANRYVDHLGIVRSTLDESPVHGGTTATIVVTLQPSPHTSLDHVTILTANVGDSTALLVSDESDDMRFVTHLTSEPIPDDAKDVTFLTVDHGPENPSEYARVAQLPSALHPTKLLFVYDQSSATRKYKCPLVFDTATGRRNAELQNNPWAHGLHPTNVRFEPAVYAVTPQCVTRDSTCIAMTRALGDFYAHQFGLSALPSIQCHQVETDRASRHTVILASDGIWDVIVWSDLARQIRDRRKQQAESVHSIGQKAIDEAVTKAIANFGKTHFDDASLIFWQISNSQQEAHENTTLGSDQMSTRRKVEQQVT